MVMALADRVAPRVGTLVVDNGELMSRVHEMCPNHAVKHLVLCGGTDRYVGPNKTMYCGEAPLRRMDCIRCKIEDVQVDATWEPWERLTQKGLRRKSMPARVSFTIFAQAQPLLSQPESTPADVPIPSMPVPGHDVPELPEPTSKRSRKETNESGIPHETSHESTRAIQDNSSMNQQSNAYPPSITTPNHNSSAVPTISMQSLDESENAPRPRNKIDLQGLDEQ